MENYKVKVEKYLWDEWFIDVIDITTDFLIEDAFNCGESVEEFCDGLAKKYDLVNIRY